MKTRVLGSALALGGLLALASPASAQVYYGSGYTPYAGSVVTGRAFTPGTAFGIPSMGSVAVSGYNPYTAGNYHGSPYTAGNYYNSPYTAGSVYNGYQAGYNPYAGYSPYAGGYSPYAGGYSPYSGYANYYGGRSYYGPRYR